MKFNNPLLRLEIRGYGSCCLLKAVLGGMLKAALPLIEGVWKVVV